MDFNPATQTGSILRQWKTAFEERNVEALVALYSAEAFLFGGKPTLAAGVDGIRAYFEALPTVPLLVNLEEQSVQLLAPTVISTGGFVAFRRVNGPAARYRLTLTLVLSGTSWKIASHHASPLPA